MNIPSEVEAVEYTERSGYEAGLRFLWCIHCARSFLDEVADNPSDPARMLSADDLTIGTACEVERCGGIWNGSEWMTWACSGPRLTIPLGARFAAEWPNLDSEERETGERRLEAVLCQQAPCAGLHAASNQLTVCEGHAGQIDLDAAWEELGREAGL